MAAGQDIKDAGGALIGAVHACIHHYLPGQGNVNASGLTFGVGPVRRAVAAREFAPAQFLRVACDLNAQDGHARQTPEQVVNPARIFPDNVVNDGPGAGSGGFGRLGMEHGH